MQYAPLTKTQRAEWQEMLAPASAGQIGVFAALFLFSAMIVPLSHVPTAAALYLLVAGITYAICTRSLIAVLAVGMPAFLLFSVSYLLIPTPIVVTTAFVALLMGALSGAFLLVHCRTAKKRALLALLPVAAYLVPTLLTGNPLPGLCALIPTLLAIVLAYCVLSCKPLTPSVILIAVTLACLAIGTVFVALAALGFPEGGLVDGLVSFVRGGFTAYYDGIAELYQTEQALLGDSVDLYAAMGEALNPSPRLIRTYADTLSTALPGLFTALCLVMGFGMWRMLLRTLSTFGTIPKTSPRLSQLRVSAVAAGIFLAADVLYLLSGETLFGLICFNIAAMLTPALALVGFTSLVDPSKGRSCLSLLLAIGIIFLLMQNIIVGLSLAAFVGAFHILLSRFMRPFQKGEP